MRVVCLISGDGSNLQALLDWQSEGLLGDAKIVGVDIQQYRCRTASSGQKTQTFQPRYCRTMTTLTDFNLIESSSN